MRFDLVSIDLDKFENKDDIKTFLVEYDIPVDYLNLDELMMLKIAYKYAYIDTITGCMFSVLRRIDVNNPHYIMDVYGPFLDIMYNIKPSGFSVRIQDEDISNLIDVLRNPHIDYNTLSIEQLEIELKYALDNEDYERAVILKEIINLKS